MIIKSNLSLLFSFSSSSLIHQALGLKPLTTQSSKLSIQSTSIDHPDTSETVDEDVFEEDDDEEDSIKTDEEQVDVSDLTV